MVFLGYVNLFMALFNLAPAQGLDGKVAWRIIPLLLERWHGRRF
jgi:Zn-dependent protease